MRDIKCRASFSYEGLVRRRLLAYMWTEKLKDDVCKLVYYYAVEVWLIKKFIININTKKLPWLNIKYLWFTYTAKVKYGLKLLYCNSQGGGELMHIRSFDKTTSTQDIPVVSSVKHT